MNPVRNNGISQWFDLLLQFHNETYDTCICNPVGREWMVLSRQRHFIKGLERKLFVYGFGVGLKTKEYKVIRIFQENILHSISRGFCLKPEVFTLGSGVYGHNENVVYRKI